jgi:hypothetical protein
VTRRTRRQAVQDTALGIMWWVATVLAALLVALGLVSLVVLLWPSS